MFFGCFWAYVRQPHSHIRWATSMSFASINSTNPRTNLWICCEKFWELSILKNSVFLSRPFWIFFFQKRKKKLLFSWKSVQIYMVEWMFSLVSRKFLAMGNITLYSVYEEKGGKMLIFLLHKACVLERFWIFIVLVLMLTLARRQL